MTERDTEGEKERTRALSDSAHLPSPLGCLPANSCSIIQAKDGASELKVGPMTDQGAHTGPPAFSTRLGRTLPAPSLNQIVSRKNKSLINM